MNFEIVRKVILILALFLCCVSSFSQETFYGAKAGLNLSTVTGNVSEGVNPRLAYHFGGFASIPITDRFSLNPELLYFSIGNTFNFASERFFGLDPSENYSFKSAERANFLALPVNFRFSFTENFGLDFGPQVSFLLNSFSKIKEANSVDPIFVEDRRLPGNFRPDYGANLGLTFLPSEKINIQLRYYQGLKNLIQGGSLTGNQSNNVALQLSAGYVIF